jgi:hypothetical protein
MVKVPIYPPVVAIIYGYHIVVGGAITILKNMSSSMGRMTSHI